MSDSAQPPPSKSKPGSLRDRIAAFEKPTPGPLPSAPKPPPVRPKPVAWKPTPHSPVSNASETAEHDEKRSVGGMSASDAKESIGKGGSLKERMAALQGRGAFGGGAIPGPPPLGPKPVKRPPLVVPPPPKEESEEEATEVKQEKIHVEPGNNDHPLDSEARDETGDTHIGAREETSKEDMGEPVHEEQDEETKERERRAAIAARMARLGGARVGLAPPVFGKKAEVKEKPKVASPQEIPPSVTSESTVLAQEHGLDPSAPSEDSAAQLKVEPPPANTVPEIITDDVGITGKNQAASFPPPLSQLSPTAAQEMPSAVDSDPHPNPDAMASQSLHASARTPLLSMPIPAAPRRAGPPRKKSARNLKAEAKAQDNETPQNPLIHAEAPTELEGPALTRQEPLPVGPGVESEHEEQEPSVQHDTSDASEAVSGQASNALPEEGISFASASVEVTDEELVSKSPKESIHEASYQLTTDIDRGTPTDDTPKPEIETHRSAVDVSISQDIAQVTDAHESNAPPHAPPHSLVDVSRISESSKSQIVLSGERPADVDSMMSPVGHPSEHNPESNVSASVSVVPADEPTDGSSEEAEAASVLEPELQATTVTQDQPEDNEADRRMRIAERLAKMGGRNPFSANPLDVLGPSIKGSGDKPREVDKVLSHEESSVEESTHVDTAQEGGALTELAIGVESRGREADVHEPRVSTAEEEQHGDVTILQGSVEESEAIHPEHIFHLSRVDPEAQLETAPSKQESLPFSPEVDEMTPPRITRAIPPPPPPQASVEASPNAILQRQYVSLVPEEVSSVTQEPVATDDEIDIHASREGRHDQVGMAPLDPLPSVNTIPLEAVERASSSSTMSRRSIASSPPITPITSSAVVSTEFRSPVSPSSRKSLPPPQRKPSSPSDDSHPMRDSSPSLRSTSPRRAVPVSVRPPVPQTIRSSSPETPSSPSKKPRRNSVRRSIPPPPPIPSQATEDIVAPPYPRRMSSQRVEEAIPSIRRGSSNDATDDALPLARAIASGIQAVPRESFEEQEILAESEPDPIDPAFYSPPRSPAIRDQHPLSFTSGSREASEENAADDSEQTRRRTIAERMAKLGGIRFGAPPPIPHKPTAPLPQSPSTEVTVPDGRGRELDTDNSANQVEAGLEEPDSQEAERTRRQAIAARLAGLGGMRFGMLPQMSASKPPLSGSDDNAAQTVEQSPVLPQSLAVEADSESVSDEGVKIEAGSELSMEEVNPEEAEEEAEEIPPPVPSRPSRPSHPSSSDVPPPLPGGRRPPVPMSAPTRPPVPKTESKRASVSDSVRKASGSLGHHIPPPGDFVMIEESQEIPPPPPPPRSRPSRPPVPPPGSLRDMDSSPWELPEIPRGSFDVNVPSDLGIDSSILSEDSTTYPAASAPPPPPPPHFDQPSTAVPAPVMPGDVQLSADDLLQLWGSVGTAVYAAASALFEKSKKSIVGDGTSQGFVNAALAQVPRAWKASYGHLIYSQNGSSVLRRSSTIMPGDIIQLTEAKLKGHKGLQSYHQTAGTAQDPLVGIVSEFEAKKSKVKVFQANQHVGSQTVEAVSYRLDDLKSGSVKVFRVASM